MTDRQPTPSDFTVLLTVKQWNSCKFDRNGNRLPCAVCPVCRLACAPRNLRAHSKACARRKRLAPELWREWKDDMHRPLERTAAPAPQAQAPRTRFQLTNVSRSSREYRADIEIDGRTVGYVERAESGKMLGYRAGTYRAHIDGKIVATADSLAELSADLREHFSAEWPDARESW